METCANPDFFERFQTAIVGVVGFAGVVITLVVNASLVRRERRETLKQERTALRTALVEELKILKVPLEDVIQEVEERLEEGREAGGVIVPTNPISDVYNAYVPKLGLLTSQEVEKVMWAYLSVRQFRMNLILLSGATILDEHRVDVPGNSIATFIEMQKKLLPILDDAIMSLSRGD